MRVVLLVAVFALLAILPPDSSKALTSSALTFRDYDAFSETVDKRILKRQFGALIQAMSQTPLSLAQVQQMDAQTRRGFPEDFTHHAVMRREEMENGFSHEVRAYWTGETYLYVYFLIHERENDVMILHIGLHRTPAQAFALF